MVWIEFLICAGLLSYFAYNLCREGIIISEKTSVGEGLIGMIFLAVATSFPEIVTAAVSVFSLGRIGLGFGDIVGSVIVNLMILFVLDYCYGRGRILLKVSRENRLTGFFVVVAAVVVLIAAILRMHSGHIPAFKGVGIESVFIVCLYFLCVGMLRRSGSAKCIELFSAEREPFWKIWAKFAFFLVIVAFLGVWLAKVGEKIVLISGLSQTFTGTFLLGLTTSLPEIIVSFTALRAGSVDMAIGNVLGSNLFDISVIPLLDALSKDPILGLLSTGQIMATVLVVILSAIAVLGMITKRDSARRISWDTVTIFSMGFAGFVLLYYIH